MCKKENPNNKRLLATAVWQNGGFSAKFKVQFFVGKFSGKNPCLRIAENR